MSAEPASSERLAAAAEIGKLAGRIINLAPTAGLYVPIRILISGSKEAKAAGEKL